MLTRIEATRCVIDGCTNTAYWSWLDEPFCYAEFAAMASLNSDNEEAFQPVLIEPVLVPSEVEDETTLIIYRTTCLAPICACIDQLSLFLQGFQISLRTDDGEEIGNGLYERDVPLYLGCHAPLLAIGDEIGQLVGLGERINRYSRQVWAHVQAEWKEELTTY